MTLPEIEVGTFLTKDGLPTMGLMIQTVNPVDLKQQITSEHIKAEKYDSLMNANSGIVQNNIDITKDHIIIERLKNRIIQLEETHTRKECDVLEGVDIVLLLIEELKTILGETND